MSKERVIKKHPKEKKSELKKVQNAFKKYFEENDLFVKKNKIKK